MIDTHSARLYYCKLHVGRCMYMLTTPAYRAVAIMIFGWSGIDDGWKV
jgi:hypothetical protein